MRSTCHFRPAISTLFSVSKVSNSSRTNQEHCANCTVCCARADGLRSACTAPSNGRRGRTHLCRRSTKCWGEMLRGSNEANIPLNPGSSRACCATPASSTVIVSTVQQTIVFPSVLDYVRFQLVATPMTMLLKDKTEPEREAIISSVASTAATLSTSSMLDGGKFAFPQEAYVAIASLSDDVG